MATFTYTIKNQLGDLKQGKVQAANQNEAADLIQKEGYFILEIKKGHNKKQKLSAFERINFTDHLASAVEAGVPFRDALEAYADDGGKLTPMVNSMVKTIEQGKKISQAFAEFPEVFSCFYVSLVKAGEQVGNLGETLAFLANELRRENDFKHKVKSALFYPAIVIFVALLVMGLVMFFIVPKISEITQNLGAKLPLATRILLDLSAFGHRYWLIILVLICLLPFGFIWLVKHSRFSDSLATSLLKVPVLGPITKKYTLYRFLRVLASCIKHGINLSEAFASTEEVMGLPVYKQACRQMNRLVQKGQSLSVAIEAQGKELFPSLLVRTVRGSEKTGKVDSAMNRLSVQYEMEVDRDLKRFTDLLEPIVVVVLGIMVLGIAMSVIAPIYQLTSQIK